MKKLSLLSASAFLFASILVVSATSVAEARSPSAAFEARLKESYNTMVQDVREAKTPTAKQEIIDGFLARHEQGLGLLEKMLPASNESRIAATSMRARIHAYRVELAGMDMQGSSASTNLNAFASYLQQTVEQADGIYLSVGAIIIILLVLIILL